MNRIHHSSLACFAGAAFTLVAAASPARCQDTGGYGVTEYGREAQHGESLPVRMARFDYISGRVTWRPESGQSWRGARMNQEIGLGGQVWVEQGGRAEIRFDDGSALRLGSGAIVTVRDLYRDSVGEFARLDMNAGLATVRIFQSYSVFQVDLPALTLKMAGPARVRLGAGDDMEVGVQEGSVKVEGPGGGRTIQGGDYLTLDAGARDYAVGPLPQPDSWERWNDERDRADTAPPPAYRRHPVNLTPFWLSLGLVFDFGRHGEGYVHYDRGIPRGRWHHGWR